MSDPQPEPNQQQEQPKQTKTIFQEELTFEKTQNVLNFLENNAQNIKSSIKNANFKNGTQNIMQIILQEKNT